MGLPALVALSASTAAVGTLGGIGGAVILVPLLVLLGVEPSLAAPLGIMSVAAASLSAGPRQLGEGLVHHRMGIALEITASAGAIVGALSSDAIPASLLARILAVVAMLAAVVGLKRKGVRNPPRPEFSSEVPGEWPGSLGGSYRLGDGVVPYTAQRLPAGLISMLGAGLVSGMAGVGGGFIKTPIMSELMRVPVKVAAATSTFTVAITSATALLVFAGQGRIDYHSGAAIVAGGLVGGTIGSSVQQRLHPRHVRVVVALVLLVIGAMLMVRG